MWPKPGGVGTLPVVIEYLQSVGSFTTFITGAALATLLVCFVTAFTNTRIATRTLSSQRQLARDEHDHQRALSSDARVFEHRAKTYVEATRLLLVFIDANNNVRSPEEWDELVAVHGQGGPPDDLVARMSVYGTSRAVDLFMRSYGCLYDAARQAHTHRHLAFREDGDKGWGRDTLRFMRSESENNFGEGWRLYEELTDCTRKDLHFG